MNCPAHRLQAVADADGVEIIRNIHTGRPERLRSTGPIDIRAITIALRDQFGPGMMVLPAAAVEIGGSASEAVVFDVHRARWLEGEVQRLEGVLRGRAQNHEALKDKFRRARAENARLRLNNGPQRNKVFSLDKREAEVVPDWSDEGTRARLREDCLRAYRNGNGVKAHRAAGELLEEFGDQARIALSYAPFGKPVRKAVANVLDLLSLPTEASEESRDAVRECLRRCAETKAGLKVHQMAGDYLLQHGEDARKVLFNAIIKDDVRAAVDAALDAAGIQDPQVELFKD